MRFSEESYMRNLGGMNLGDNLGRQRHVAERFLDHIAVSFFSCYTRDKIAVIQQLFCCDSSCFGACSPS